MRIGRFWNVANTATGRWSVPYFAGARSAYCFLPRSNSGAANRHLGDRHHVLRKLSLHRQKDDREGFWRLKVTVSFKEKTAVVVFDDARAEVKDLTNATTSAGLPSTPKSREGSNSAGHREE